LRRVPIRIKLAGALAAPLLGLLTIILFEVTNTSREVSDVRSQTELATATIGPTGLITSLQNERNWAVTELIGQQEQVTLEVTGYPETRAQTDEALEEFRDAVERKGGDIERAFAPALEGLSGPPSASRSTATRPRATPTTSRSPTRSSTATPR
jgi:hypothetical protein